MAQDVTPSTSKSPYTATRSPARAAPPTPPTARAPAAVHGDPLAGARRLPQPSQRRLDVRQQQGVVLGGRALHEASRPLRGAQAAMPEQVAHQRGVGRALQLAVGEPPAQPPAPTGGGH